MGCNARGRCHTAASIINFIQSWRLPELFCVVMAWEIFKLVIKLASEYEQYVPPNNAQGVNGYPVRLGSEWCFANQFSSCEALPNTTCCQEMEGGIHPGETVTSITLFFIYFWVPLVFIFVRQSLMKCGYWRGSGTFADAFLGMLLCLLLCIVATDTIKVLIGRPRPNYFALQALKQFGGSGMYSSLGKTSVKSFPSGHSAESMAGTFYVTLICWADVSRYPGAHRGWRRSLLAYLAVLPAMISVWVGITRVRDYWHFQDDVLAGWAIGATSAAVAVRWITFPETFWRKSLAVDRDNLSPSDQNSGFALMTDSTYGSNGFSVGDCDIEQGSITSPQHE